MINEINQNLTTLNTNLKSIFTMLSSNQKGIGDIQVMLMNMSNDIAYLQQQIEELKNQQPIEKSNNNFEIY